MSNNNFRGINLRIRLIRVLTLTSSLRLSYKKKTSKSNYQQGNFSKHLSDDFTRILVSV